MNNVFVEYLGYIATILILVSMMMNSIVKLRIYNVIGALTFGIYGFIIGSIPVAITNIFIVCINIYHLIKMVYAKKTFSFIELPSDSDFLQKFTEKQKLNVADNKYSHNLLITDDALVVGVLMCYQLDDKHIFIDVMHIAKGNNIKQIANFMFVENSKYFKDKGFDILVTNISAGVKDKTLQEIGFVQQSDKDYIFELGIS